MNLVKLTLIFNPNITINATRIKGRFYLFFIFKIDTIHSCYSNLHFLLKITKNLNGLSRKDGRI